MARTEITGKQVKDETILAADIGAGAVRGSDANGGSQREILQGTVSDVDLRDDAVTAAKLDETADFQMAILAIGGSAVTDTILSLNTTTKALLLPRLTTTQRNNIGTPIDGMLIFNSTDGVLNLYSTTWGELSVTETDPLSIHLNGDNSPSAAIDWNQQEIQQLVVHKLSADPVSPVEGQIWYNTTDKQWKGKNDTEVVILG